MAMSSPITPNPPFQGGFVGGYSRTLTLNYELIFK